MDKWFKIAYVALGVFLFVAAFFVKDKNEGIRFAKDKELARRTNKRYVWTLRAMYITGAIAMIAVTLLCEHSVASLVVGLIVPVLTAAQLILNKIFYGVIE